MTMDDFERECVTEVFRNEVECCVRVTHRPSGLQATRESVASQILARWECLTELRRRLTESSEQ